MSKSLSALLGLVLLALMAVGVWLALQWGIGVLQNGGKPADAVSFLAVAGLGGVSYLYKETRERQQQLEARLASAKRERYEAYVDALKDVISQTQAGKEPDSAAFVSKLRDFGFRSILVASDPVVMAHIRVTNLDRIAPGDPTMLMAAVGDVLLALRKDMGFADTKLTNQAILGVFVKDVDKTPKPFAKWAAAKVAWDQKMGWTNKWGSKK